MMQVLVGCLCWLSIQLGALYRSTFMKIFKTSCSLHELYQDIHIGEIKGLGRDGYTGLLSL